MVDSVFQPMQHQEQQSRVLINRGALQLQRQKYLTVVASLFALFIWYVSITKQSLQNRHVASHQCLQEAHTSGKADSPASAHPAHAFEDNPSSSSLLLAFLSSFSSCPSLFLFFIPLPPKIQLSVWAGNAVSFSVGSRADT